MGYNKDAIAALAEPKAIASYLGVEMRKSGKYTFIRCPMHERTLGKADSKISNCVLTKRGFHCFACGAFGDVFDMVTAYTGCSYPDALKTVGDACGGAESFLENNSHHPKKIFNGLSSEDLALIGLSCVFVPEKSDEGRLLYNVSSKKESETEKIGCTRKGDEYLLYQKAERNNLRVLQFNDPQAYCDLIIRKAQETVVKYQRAKNECDSKDSTMYKELIILLSSDGKFHSKNFLPLKVTEGIKDALEKKQKRAEGIIEEYQKLKKQLQK